MKTCTDGYPSHDQLVVNEAAGSFRAAASPVVLVAALIDIACFLICLGLPVRAFAPMVVGVLGSAITLWLFLPRHTSVKAATCASVLVAVLFGLALSGTFWNTCVAGPTIYHSDSFAYSSLGRYLWNHPRATHGGLAAVDEYASMMSVGRFGTTSLLDLISVFVRPGDPAFSVMPYLSLGCTLILFATYSVSRALGLTHVSSSVAGLFAVLGSWVHNAALVANFDNITFVALLTTVVGYLVLWAMNGRLTRPDIWCLAILIAACIYTYPEGFALASVLVIPLVISLLTAGRFNMAHGAQIALVAGIALLIAWPYLPAAGAFLLNQIGYAAAVKPGVGLFDGLLSRRFLPALFALGEEYPSASFSSFNLILPAALGFVLVVGLARLWPRHRAFVLTAVPFLALSAWQVRDDLAYGLYKVVFIASWWIFPAIASGVASVAECAPLRARTAVCLLVGILMLGGVAAERAEDLPHMFTKRPACVAAESDLAGLRGIVGDAKVLVAISDAVKYQWALYYLRDINLQLGIPQGYFRGSQVMELVSRSRDARSDAPPKFILQQGRRPLATWSNGTYSLSAATDVGMILDVQNPNGLDEFDGLPFLWIGDQPARLVLQVPRPGKYRLRAEQYWLGHSAPDVPYRDLLVSIGSSEQQLRFIPGADGIEMRLPAGTSVVRIASTTPVTAHRHPNGDTRTLLLGLKGYYIAAE